MAKVVNAMLTNPQRTTRQAVQMRISRLGRVVFGLLVFGLLFGGGCVRR